jgi:hypothetical protein
MSSVSQEIKQLQQRILELESQQKETDENDKRMSISHNFQIINSVLVEKKSRIADNTYSKTIKLAKYYDQQLVTRLEAVYNILQIIDERITKLEQTK